MVIIGITFPLFLKGVVIFDAVLNDKLPISVTDFCKYIDVQCTFEEVSHDV